MELKHGSSKTNYTSLGSNFPKTDKMKYTLLSLVFFFPTFLVGQTEKVLADERLYEILEADYIENLVQQNPFLIQRWNFYLDHAFYITEDPKMSRYEYPTIRIENLDNFNILKIEQEQRIKNAYQKRVAYKIDGTNKALVYYAAKEFNTELNKHLKRVEK